MLQQPFFLASFCMHTGMDPRVPQHIGGLCQEPVSPGTGEFRCHWPVVAGLGVGFLWYW